MKISASYWIFEGGLEGTLPIHEAMEQIDHKELGLENWEKFYKEEYNKKEEEQKGKGCNYLAEEEEDIF